MKMSVGAAFVVANVGLWGFGSLAHAHCLSDVATTFGKPPPSLGFVRGKALQQKALRLDFKDVPTPGDATCSVRIRSASPFIQVGGAYDAFGSVAGLSSIGAPTSEWTSDGVVRATVDAPVGNYTVYVEYDSRGDDVDPENWKLLGTVAVRVSEPIVARSFGGKAFDGGTAVNFDAASNLLIGGNFTSSANFGGTILNSTIDGKADGFLAKYTPAGALLWVRQIGGSGYVSVKGTAANQAGDVFVVGNVLGKLAIDGTERDSGASSDGYLAKLDGHTGNLSWLKMIASDGSDDATSVVVDALGNPIVVGNFGAKIDFGGGAEYLPEGSNDCYLVTFDAQNQSALTSAVVGGTGYCEANAVAGGQGGNIVVAGSFSGDVDFVPGAIGGARTSMGSRDVFVARYTPAGAFSVFRQLGGAKDDFANAVSLDKSGNIYLTGGTNGEYGYVSSGNVYTPMFTATGGSFDAFVTKIGSHAAHLWSRGLGGNKPEIGRGIAIDKLGNPWLTGNYNALGNPMGFPYATNFAPDAAFFGRAGLPVIGGKSDIFLVALDQVDGRHLWGDGFGGSSGEPSGLPPNAITEVGTAIAANFAGDLLFTGTFRGSASVGDGGTLSSSGDGEGFFDILRPW